MTGLASQPVGAFATALAHGQRLLARDPSLAETQALEILKVMPGAPEAILLLGAARRAKGEAKAALEVLSPLAARAPRWADVHYELGLAALSTQDLPLAVKAFQRAVQLAPNVAPAWRSLGDALIVSGDAKGADAAYARHIQASVNDPDLVAAAEALCDDQIAVAERLLKAHLQAFPTDVAAIRMLAETAGRIGRYGDSENLLLRALELAPSFHPARHNLAVVYYRQNKLEECLRELDLLLEIDPNDPNYRNLQAGALSRVGDVGRSIAVYEKILAEYPNQPKGWMSFGHALKTAGRRDDGVAAYRKAIQQEPSLGEAYWSLANLKMFKFDAAEVEAMEAALDRTDISVEDRFHLHYALGKAFEDAKVYDRSFEHYAEGAKLRRTQIHYDADEVAAQTDRAVRLYTPSYFAERKGQGCPAQDPIFVVGLPRSGSTLAEQILSSHSQVEGTAELPEIGHIARLLADRKSRDQASKYPDAVAELSPERLRELGELFLERTRIHRRTDKPLFIDKLPNNFGHTGLILSILPNAKIIDARRHPMATCFSAFKQHFARGQNFSYELTDLGRYYADYVRLMDHFDRALPGRVHRVIYERMVADTETEVRRLLDYCGLDFEPACLRFYENDRAVRTASSEQVRQPIFQDAVEHWKHYEPWLNPLKAALGQCLETYPDAPRRES
jgi:tetratricopeptide (TPR) repeat protein